MLNGSAFRNRLFTTASSLSPCLRKPSGVRYGIRRAGGLTALGEYDYDEKGGLAIQLVAIQMRLDVADFLTEDAFAAKIDGLLAQAAERRAGPPPGLSPGVGLMLIAQACVRNAGVSEVADAIRRVTAAFSSAWLKFRHGVSWVPASFSSATAPRHPPTSGVFEAARKYRVWIVAGWYRCRLTPWKRAACWEDWLAGSVQQLVPVGPDGKW